MAGFLFARSDMARRKDPCLNTLRRGIGSARRVRYGGTMQHVTLNTGHNRHSPRSEVADHVIELMRPLCEPGCHDLPMGDGWQLQTTPGESGRLLLFTVQHYDEPVVICAVAGDKSAAAELWPILESFYLDLTDRAPHRGIDWESPKQPETTPWLAVVLVSLTKSDVDSLRDFERCLAWAWLERHGSADSLVG